MQIKTERIPKYDSNVWGHPPGTRTCIRCGCNFEGGVHYRVTVKDTWSSEVFACEYFCLRCLKVLQRALAKIRNVRKGTS